MIGANAHGGTIFLTNFHQWRKPLPDTQYLAQLKNHLKEYLREDLKDSLNIWTDDIWDDQKMKSGEVWKKEIGKALANSRVAVLLVSADFLASDFIRDYELPILLDAAEAGEVVLLSVILSPCIIKRTALDDYQVVNDASNPLLGMAPYEQDVVWATLAQQVRSILFS